MYDKKVLGLDQAMAALNAMLAEAAKEPERPLAFAIVDDRGDLIAFARMDHVNPLPHSIALKKAYTAARMRSDTLAIAERMRSQGRSITEMGDPNMVAVQGGIVIMSESGPLGGIGVSGRRADEDEEIARIGLAALNL
jgi:glc operon protein GlcG